MIARRLVTALALALMISAVFTFWLSRRFAKPAHAAPVKQQYVAAAQNLEAGIVLRNEDLKPVDWPEPMSLDGAFVKVSDVAGRTLLYPLAAGEPILQRHLATAGTGSGLSTRIPNGMRAISLRSDEVAGVAGFAAPGSRVDVLVTYHTATSADPVTSIVLQDVQILAAGQKTQADPDGKATAADVVTLLVSPQDAEKIVRASSQGTVHFVLRNGVDHEHVVDAAAALTEFPDGTRPIPVAEPTAAVRAAQGTAAQATAKAAAKPYTVLTVNGDKTSSETFQ